MADKPTALSDQRLAEIRTAQHQNRSLANADIDITDLLTEVDRLKRHRDELISTVSSLDSALRSANSTNTVTCANCFHEQFACDTCNTELA